MCFEAFKAVFRKNCLFHPFLLPQAELQTCGGASSISGKCAGGLQCLKTCREYLKRTHLPLEIAEGLELAMRPFLVMCIDAHIPHIPNTCTYSRIYARIFSVGAIWRNRMASPKKDSVCKRNFEPMHASVTIIYQPSVPQDMP